MRQRQTWHRAVAATLAVLPTLALLVLPGWQQAPDTPAEPGPLAVSLWLLAEPQPAPPTPPPPPSPPSPSARLPATATASQAKPQRQRPVPARDTALQAITTPTPEASEVAAELATTPVAAAQAAASAATSARAQAPLRLHDPALIREASRGARSPVQAMAQQADQPLNLGHKTEAERFSEAAAASAKPKCSDPVPFGILGLPILIARPLLGSCSSK